MSGNISNKPPANSLPSECPVARKGRCHGPVADKERLSAVLFVTEAHVPLFAQTETLGNYPAAHHLQASAVVHALVSAAFGAIYL